MSNKLKSIIIAGFLTFVALVYFMIYNFQTEKFLNNQSVKFNEYIQPVFNTKVENYYSKVCNKDIYIDPKLNYKIKFEDPIIYLEFKYLNFLKKQYFITCIDEEVSALQVSNTLDNRKEFILMDDNVSWATGTSQKGIITLRDSLGTPLWWLKPSDVSFKGKKFTRFNDAKLINNGRNVVFFASTDGTSNGEYLVYDLQKDSIVKSYTGNENTSAIGNLDWHDLQFLPNGEAVGIRYVKRSNIELLNLGVPAGTEIIDSEIVLLNSDGTEKKSYSIFNLIDNKEIPINQKFYFNLNVGPLDVIHTNSVEIQGKHVIISSRHLDAIHKIDLENGNIVWRLGGHSQTPFDLKVINPSGLNLSAANLSIDNQLLSSQHDARILKNGQLSVYDNGSSANRSPRVLVFKINELKKTAEITKIVTSSSMNTSLCCGSARELEDGSWMINFGGRLSNGLLVNSLSTTVLPSGIETRTLIRPDNEFSYRAIPYYLSQEQIKLFRNNLTNR